MIAGAVLMCIGCGEKKGGNSDVTTLEVEITPSDTMLIQQEEQEPVTKSVTDTLVIRKHYKSVDKDSLLSAGREIKDAERFYDYTHVRLDSIILEISNSQDNNWIVDWGGDYYSYGKKTVVKLGRDNGQGYDYKYMLEISDNFLRNLLQTDPAFKKFPLKGAVSHARLESYVNGVIGIGFGFYVPDTDVGELYMIYIEGNEWWLEFVDYPWPGEEDRKEPYDTVTGRRFMMSPAR